VSSTAMLAVTTALPEHALDAEARHDLLVSLWPRLAMAGSSVVENGGTRYLAQPPDRLMAERGITESMRVYQEHALVLAERAARSALEAARLTAPDVDAIISVSCTGYMVPSLDVHLMQRLGMRADVVRLPITELGCSGGAAGIAFAHRHLAAYPEQNVLLIAVELPSVTFQPTDSSLDNLTASMVFGDGAGAAVMSGVKPGWRGLTVGRVASHLISNSTPMLGYDLRDDGFHVVLDRRLPRLIGRSIGEVSDRFRSAAGITSIDFVAAHGGGPRVLDALQESLHLPDSVMAASRRTYEEVGNVSSASILFTLANLLPSFGSEHRQGLGLGLGPGVSVELMQLDWQP
jgi:predicted naringenin-chalcone synthase